MKKRIAAALIGGLVLLVLTGCAASANDYAGTPAGSGDSAGFLLGIWHGFIILFAFIGSLIDHRVGIYEVHNDGFGYNFGFLIGVWLWFGGGTGSVISIRSRG